jgi:hypothetical protein
VWRKVCGVTRSMPARLQAARRSVQAFAHGRSTGPIAIWWATPESRSYLHVMSDSDVKAILEAAPDPVRQRLVSNAARDIVLGKMRNEEITGAQRWITGHPEANSALRLWQLIALWDSARDPSARDGTEQQVCDVARADPTLWIRTLPALLSDPTRWQLIVARTLLLHRDAHVRRALRELAETGPSPIASRALSLSRMVEGREAPGASEYESLLGLIASARDGYTIFPHPLALPSATWVGSRGVEDALRRLVSDACDRFAKRVPKQLGLDEEQHTRDLLRDLEDSLGRLADSPWIAQSHTGLPRPRSSSTIGTSLSRPKRSPASTSRFSLTSTSPAPSGSPLPNSCRSRSHGGITPCSATDGGSRSSR